MSDFHSEAYDFVNERHAGQMYGHRDYVQGHLFEVVRLIQQSGFTSRDIVIAGWCHDVVEDTKTTLDEVRERFGDEVARLVWAVTNEPGKNRKERALATYPKIRAAGRDAVAVKLCDRIVNVDACWKSQDAKLFMYRKEYADFRAALREEADGTLVMALWDRLDKMLGWRDTVPHSA